MTCLRDTSTSGGSGSSSSSSLRSCSSHSTAVFVGDVEVITNFVILCVLGVDFVVGCHRPIA